MTARVALQYADGSTMNVYLELTLPESVRVREEFYSISRAVKSATSGLKSGWAKYDVRIVITVLCPRSGNGEDENLVSSAVCDATGIIPSGSMNWRVTK